MDSEIDTTTAATSKEGETFLQKLSSFKEEYLKLKNFCVELLEENKTVRNRVQILENKLQSENENNQIDTIINKQQTIIEFLKNKDDYKELRRKVEILENKIKTDKSLHEREMQNMLEKNTDQMNEIRKLNENNDTNKEKLEQMQKKYDELNRKNEELSIALESMDAESGEIIARLDMEHKDQRFRLQSENQLLLEKLKNQEELYKQKIQNLEADNKNKSEFINKLIQDKNNPKRSAYQSLDEAFRPNKIVARRKLTNIDPNHDDRIFSPCVTEDGILDD
ncbi:putative leucine-rich repeat-containing protein DDB_G0290503 [Planococcus citri]|uniref:putative leucine-rich repeat-containing protein DDB_G0290503 n=1 Tax=Planococcus citri TaxID=170843 RepID=UPI0031F9B3A9